MKVGILQSNYFPWLGYFDLINYVDVFVIFDNVQFTKNDWRNRNRILSVHGPIWLTVPCKTAGRMGQAISEVEVTNSKWIQKHRSSIESSYSRAPGFSVIKKRIIPLFELFEDMSQLTDINEIALKAICRTLNIRTALTRIPELPSTVDRSERLAEICLSLSAKTYVTGPAGLTYIDEAPFKASGIELEVFNYAATQTRICALGQDPSQPLSILHDLAHGLV